MRKYFKFTTFRKNWKFFIVFMIINIIGQYHKGWWSVDNMIESNIIVTIVWILGGLVIDWIMIIRENYNAKKIQNGDKNI